MTTLHVRLPIATHHKLSRVCGDGCPHGSADRCFLRYRSGDVRRGHEPPDFTQPPLWNRTEFCLSATESDALRERLVRAALYACHVGTDGTELRDAADALRAHESKGGNDGT